MYKFILSNVERCVYHDYNKTLKREVYHYKLKANQVILEIVNSDDPLYLKSVNYDLPFTFYIHRQRSKMSALYVEDAIINNYDFLICKINEYKKLYPRRKRVLLTILKKDKNKDFGGNICQIM